MTRPQTTHTAPSFIQIVLILAPIVLFALQLIGKINPLATVAAAILVCLKAIVEWMLAAPPAQTQKKPASVKVRYARCARCKQEYDGHVFLHLTVTPDRHIRLCQTCYHSSRLSQGYSS